MKKFSYYLFLVTILSSCVKPHDPLSWISFNNTSGGEVCSLFNLESHIAYDTVHYSWSDEVKYYQDTLLLYYNDVFGCHFQIMLNPNYNSNYAYKIIPDKYNNRDYCGGDNILLQNLADSGFEKNEIEDGVFSIGLYPYDVKKDSSIISEENHQNILSFYKNIYGDPHIDSSGWVLGDGSFIFTGVNGYIWDRDEYSMKIKPFRSEHEYDSWDHPLILFEVKNYKNFMSQFLDSVKLGFKPIDVVYHREVFSPIHIKKGKTVKVPIPRLTIPENYWNRDPFTVNDWKLSDQKYNTFVDDDTLIVNFDIERMDGNLFPGISGINLDILFLDQFNNVVYVDEQSLGYEEFLYDSGTSHTSNYWTSKYVINNNEMRKIKNLYENYYTQTGRANGIKIKLDYKAISFLDGSVLTK